MASTEGRLLIRIVCFGLALSSLSVTAGFCQDDPPPKLRELLKSRDPLLKNVFKKSPESDVKGLASKIRADELDVKNRIRACRYLATADCRAYPKAPKMLVKVLHEDQWEEVRYEAAKALKIMLAAGACSEKREESNFPQWLGRWKRNSRRNPKEAYKNRRDYCPGCCEKDVLDALSKTAYERNDRGNCFEPSKRVREMAAEALKSCGIKCNNCNCPRPGAAGGPEEMGPPPNDPPARRGGEGVVPKTRGEGQVPGANGGEGRTPGSTTPPMDPASPNVTTTPRRRSVPVRRVSNSAAVSATVPSLNGLCVVSLMNERRLAAKASITTVYKGRQYAFFNTAAKAEFEKRPERYAVAYGGFDPVQYVKSRKMVNGRLLCKYGGRFYSFSSQQNWDEFKRNSARYVASPKAVATR